MYPLGGWDAGIPLINGWVGVDLFFVLSGFLITHHICGRYRRQDGRIDFRDYLWRRALRIVPAYYAVCWWRRSGWCPICRSNQKLMALRIGYHLLFLQDYLPSNILATFWSLGVEEKFYLLSPLLLMAVFRLRRPAQQYAAIAALSALPIVLRWLIQAASCRARSTMSTSSVLSAARSMRAMRGWPSACSAPCSTATARD